MNKNREQNEALNPTQQLVQKLQENRKSLHIARIPDNTKETFIALAEEQFCGDYGMTLKWLIDDMLSQDTKLVIEKLEEIEARLQVLESKKPVEEAKPESVVKMLDGKTKLNKEDKANDK